MGVKVFFILVVESLCEYVYIMLWSGEYFRVVVIMVFNVCYNGVKFDGLVFFCVCLIYWYVCRKGSVFCWRRLGFCNVDKYRNNYKIYVCIFYLNVVIY